MPTPSIETARGWLGRTMVDRDSNRIGEVADIYLDNETGRPEWAVVRTGLFGMRSTFVPLAEATEVGDELRVPHNRTQVKDAPNIDPDGRLSEAEEAELYRHYGLDYDTVTLEAAAAASRTDEPEVDQQAPAGASRIPEQGGEPVEPAGEEDRVPVGEGVSRPFVYETPGPPEGAAGTRRRQPGQVRLRRYLVTEVVTDTESGQRHEVRVQSEPVSEAEVDAVLAAPDRQSEPAGQEPAGSDRSGWFDDEGDPRR
jgi:PRC-barrel domain/Domain of unknown function (DUF2382)